jgi:hypothetical protein
MAGKGGYIIRAGIVDCSDYIGADGFAGFGEIVIGLIF